MLTSNLGDMARILMMSQQTTRVKTQLSALTAELSSGRKSDLQGHLKGVFAPLAGVEHSLKLIDSYSAANREAAQFAEAQQLALDNVQAVASTAGADFLNVASTGEATQRAATYARAEDQLEQVVARLNTQFAGRTLFGGVATTAPALADAATLLADLSAAVGTPATGAAALAAVDAWFDTPGGGFETLGYLGSTTDLAPFAIGEGETESLSTRADAAPFREVLKGLAITALMGKGLLSGNTAAQKQILNDAGGRLVNAADDVIAVQAGIGYSEERIVMTQQRSDTQAVAYELAKNALVEADPYDTATKLQQVESQLETIFTLTARLSTLSLAKVLR
ncbi:MAG: hypothetical protein KDA50_03355 [Rhodobacteraceae bacterium]|nr:hypothetical protein [Paracoccaceae bacterium]